METIEEETASNAVPLDLAEEIKEVPKALTIDELVCEFKQELDEFKLINDNLVNGHKMSKIKVTASHKDQLS